MIRTLVTACILTYVFVGNPVLLAQETPSQPQVWSPSADQTDLQRRDIYQCRDVARLCVRIGLLDVKDTPNDSGQFEEWVFKATFEGEENGGFKHKGKMKIKNPKVPDRLSNGSSLHNVDVLGEVCFEGSEAILRTSGHENDRAWRTDPIPHFGVIIRNACFNNPNNQVQRYDTLQMCDWDRSGKRRACLNLGAEYKLR